MSLSSDFWLFRWPSAGSIGPSRRRAARVASCRRAKRPKRDPSPRSRRACSRACQRRVAFRVGLTSSDLSVNNTPAAAPTIVAVLLPHSAATCPISNFSRCQSHAASGWLLFDTLARSPEFRARGRSRVERPEGFRAQVGPAVQGSRCALVGVGEQLVELFRPARLEFVKPRLGKRVGVPRSRLGSASGLHDDFLLADNLERQADSVASAFVGSLQLATLGQTRRGFARLFWGRFASWRQTKLGICVASSSGSQVFLGPRKLGEFLRQLAKRTRVLGDSLGLFGAAPSGSIVCSSAQPSNLARLYSICSRTLTSTFAPI